MEEKLFAEKVRAMETQFPSVGPVDLVRYIESVLPWDAFLEILWSQARGRYESRVVIGEEIGFGRSKRCMDAAVLQAFWNATGIHKDETLYALDPFFPCSSLMLKYQNRPKKESAHG